MSYLPMDEALTRVAIDLSNRPYLVWKVELPMAKLGEMDTELFREFFQAFVQNAGATLHVENLYGGNTHHIVETCFKGLARALRQAVEIDERAAGAVPSPKGTLSAQGPLTECRRSAEKDAEVAEPSAQIGRAHV